MTRDEVIDVLSVVAAATRRTVGELDVTIWQGVIGSLDKADAIQAVGDHLRDKPGVWLEPGHVYQRARENTRNKSMNAVVAETKAAIEAAKPGEHSSAEHRRRLIEEFARKQKSPEPLKPGEAESA